MKDNFIRGNWTAYPRVSKATLSRPLMSIRVVISIIFGMMSVYYLERNSLAPIYSVDYSCNCQFIPALCKNRIIYTLYSHMSLVLFRLCFIFTPGGNPLAPCDEKERKDWSKRGNILSVFNRVSNFKRLLFSFEEGKEIIGFKI